MMMCFDPRIDACGDEWLGFYIFLRGH